MMLDGQDQYLKAIMMLCNQLASIFKSTRVSLGWMQGQQIKLQAMSHMQKFDRRLPEIKRLESTMEECADQDEEVTWPRFPTCNYICREHEKLVRSENGVTVASLPLRYKDHVIGVLTLESDTRLLTREDLQSLRLVCDLCARRLQDLYERNRWIGARWAHSARKMAAKLVGVEHTWAKVIAVVLMVALGFLIFYPWFYRVETSFTLRTETLIHRPAPMDGYIKEVLVEVGDAVKPNQVLMRLDKRELAIKKNEIEAKIKRFQAEAQAAQSNGEVSKMHQANIQRHQAEAELKRIEYKLDHADIKAKTAGIIVEGDHSERIHAPVSKGDKLFKISRLNDTYLRLKIPEEEIELVRDNAKGEFAFSSRPDTKYELQIKRIEPAGKPEKEGTVFYAKAQILNSPKTWWRPGMNGVAKVNVGEKSLLWVLTHRLVDFLRMKLWL